MSHYKKPHIQEKPFDAHRAIHHLRRLFDLATAKMDRPARVKGKPNQLYTLQVEMMYLIDEIERGPLFSAKKAINDANQLIESISEA